MINLIDFKYFIIEKKINEIGDYIPMEWEISKEDLANATYEFYLGPEKYEVFFSKVRDKEVHIYFSVDGDRSTITNTGNPLKVFSTVMGTIKDYLNKNQEINTISFTPEKNLGPEDNRRLDIYLYYINKFFPNSRISLEELPNGYVGVSAKIK